MAHLNTTWKHIRRSPYQATAAILIMTLTFFIVSIFAFVFLGSSKIINFFESKPQVTAFFKDEAKQENIEALEAQLNSTGKIANIKFVSKEEALAIYREQNKEDPLLLDLVTADILPSSLEISTVKIDDLSSISDTIKKSPFIQEVIFQKDVVSSLTSWTNAFRQIGIALVAIFSLVSIFIIVTVIGIKISQKKYEIEVMRLLGASMWHVRWPFILEGIFYAVAGAFLGWIISSSILLYVSPFLSSFLRGIPIFPIPWIFFLELLGGEIVLAVILGVISSYLAVLRYLK
ncbi:MAG: ABC transporter permease [Patescibacteria group bacterium]|nr:ABC transporter permease [Patescibacteria group bacterium]